MSYRTTVNFYSHPATGRTRHIYQFATKASAIKKIAQAIESFHPCNIRSIEVERVSWLGGRWNYMTLAKLSNKQLASI